MNQKELKKIWNTAKKDAKKHPHKYKPKYPSLWQIGEAKRLKKELDKIIILEKIPQKGFSKNQPSMCEECNGEGKLLVASGYSVVKNNRTFSKVKKEWARCEGCNGNGYVV